MKQFSLPTGLKNDNDILLQQLSKKVNTIQALWHLNQNLLEKVSERKITKYKLENLFSDLKTYFERSQYYCSPLCKV